MARKRRRRGEVTSWDEPVWEPLEKLLGIYVEDFMWMHAVTLKDGTRIHAYKHCDTRQYLYLSDDARPFVYEGERFYREVETRERTRELVDLVMPWACDFSCRRDWSCHE
jgi:hypothetical protein